MKNNINILVLIVVAIMGITIFLPSCKKDDVADKPTISVSSVGDAQGWYGDKIVFDITINSTVEVKLLVVNNLDEQKLEDTYQAGESKTQFTFTMPSDLIDQQEIKVTFVVTNTESGLSSTVEETITAISGGTGEVVTHEGTITEDETWVAGNIHLISGHVYLKGGTITIEPGTVLKFEQGAALVIGDEQNTTFIAQGTAEKPITFTSANETPAPGDWEYVEFNDGITSNTVLEYCNFEYGGGDSYYNYAVGINDCFLKIDNCTFKNIQSSALRVIGDEEMTSFTNNTISDCGSYPIQINMNLAHSIGAGNSITSADYGVLILDPNFTLVNASWRKLDVAYVFTENVDIQSESAQGATLTLEAGVTIAFAENIGMDIGDSESGALIANGTALEPVTFTSSQATPAAGDWKNIYIDENAQSSTNFTYCIFEYGGADNYYDFTVGMNSSEAGFSNCIFRHSERQGIRLYDEAEFSAFENNTIESCGTYPMSIFPNYVHTIGTGNTFTTEQYGIYIDNDQDYTLTTEHTWEKQTCAYIIDGCIDIQSDYGSGAILRIAPGAEFHFKSGGSIEVADSYAGTLLAVGTATEPIIFTTNNSIPKAGQWRHIYFDSNTNPGTIMEYCNVSYGSEDSYYKGNIILDGTTNVTIQNCTLSNSDGYGLYLMYDAHPVNTDYETSNTFIDNALGNVGLN